MEQTTQDQPNFQQTVICNFPMALNNIQQPPTTIEPKPLNLNALNSIFAFIATFFLSLLQLKSQGDHTISPFSSNPLTILLSTVWLLLYFCAYAGCLKPSPPSSSSSLSSPTSPPPPTSPSTSLSSTPLSSPSSMSTPSPPTPPTTPLPSSPTRATITKYHLKVNQEMMIVFGALALTSLGSLLFPSSTQHYALYTMYAIVGLGAIFHRLRLDQSISQAISRRSLLPLHNREIIQP